MALSDLDFSYQQPQGLPDADALRQLAGIWASGRSGVLRFGTGRVVLVHGEPREAQDMGLLMDAVWAGERFTFSEADAFGRPPVPSLGRAIWSAAERLTRPQDMRGSARSVIHRGGLFQRISAFPLQTETVRLLRTQGATVGETVRLDKPTRLLVLNDLAVLRLLGGVEIEIPVAKPRRPRGRTRPSTPPAAAAPGPARPTSDRPPRELGRPDPALHRRLMADLERTEGADPWTIVGVARGSLKAQVDTWCERMLKRYSDILERPLERETRMLAEAMHMRVRDAVLEVRRAPSVEERDGPRIKSIDELDRSADVDDGDFWRG